MKNFIQEGENRKASLAAYARNTSRILKAAGFTIAKKISPAVVRGHLLRKSPGIQVAVVGSSAISIDWVGTVEDNKAEVLKAVEYLRREGFDVDRRNWISFESLTK